MIFAASLACNRSFRWLFPFLAAIGITAPAFGASGADALAALRREVAASPAQAPGAVVRAIRASDSSDLWWPARVTAVAIQGLGPEATGRQTSAIVYAAVRAAPDYAQEIVRAAMLSSPNDQAPNIAAAAVAASPNPWKKVLYHQASEPRLSRLGEVSFPGEVDGKDLGGKDIADNRGIAAADKTMTLAEAIVQTVLDTRGGISSYAVLIAVDATLVGDPSWLVGAVNDPSMIAALGDSGLSNFGNEPLGPLPPPPVVGGPGIPDPPPVSQ